ncbi:MAG: MFS transporter [Anaerolineae bacterium]
MKPSALGTCGQDARPAHRPRVILLMTLGHILNDLYANSLTPILPILIEHFGLSMAQVGLLTTLRMFSGQAMQPLYGFLGDRVGRRWLLGLGPFLTVALMGLTGWAPNYGVLVLFVVLAGFGTASFHPQGAVVAGQAGGRRHGLGMGVFLSGGVIGVALAPWLIVPIVSRWGLKATLLAAVPGLLVGIFLWCSERGLDLGPVARRQVWRLNLGGHGGALTLLLFISMFRTVMESSMITFLPVLMRQREFSLMGAGAILSAFLLGTAVASVVGGYLGDRADPRRVMGGALLLGVPLMQVALRLEGAWMVALWVLAGMCFMSSMTLNTAVAQRLAPGDVGTASSVMMGLGMGLGGAGATLVGHLADAIGLIPAFTWVAWLPLLPAALTLFLPPIPRYLAQAMPDGA